ncbi:hypothetical protein IT575_07655 [bacterium]|nr:hypothetical protein [bacterium]
MTTQKWDGLVLRFRDLVTDLGGTISEHSTIAAEFGSVWWGWWKKQYEVVPKEVFIELAERVSVSNNEYVYLFDAGQGLMYRAGLIEVRTSPNDTGIQVPDSHLCPEYYQRGKYFAWFLLSSITPITLEELNASFVEFPTRGDTKFSDLRGARIIEQEQLRATDVTLWQIAINSK